MAVSCENYVEEGQYGHESRQYGGLASKAVETISASKDNFSGARSIGATCRKPAGSDGAKLKQDIRGLLQHAGFAEVVFNDYGSSSTFTVSVEEKEGLGMVRFAAALATPLREDAHNLHAAVLDMRDAEQIVTHELSQSGASFAAAGLLAVRLTVLDQGGTRYGAGVAAPTYKDVDLAGYPFGPIAFMREDGFPSKFAVEKHTRIDVRSNATGVQKALEENGLSATRSDDGERVFVKADVDQVAAALAQAGLLPPNMAGEIAATRAVTPVARKQAPAPKV